MIAVSAIPVTWPATSTAPPPSRPPATVVAVTGVQGGAGTSTLALHLAAAWARHGPGPVLLADLAGTAGGVAYRLDLHPSTPTWSEVAALPGATERGIAPADLTAGLACPLPGLLVLPLPGWYDWADGPVPGSAVPPPALVGAVMAAARHAVRTVVVDLPTSTATSTATSTGPTGPAAAAAAALAVADVRLAVGRPDSAGLHALQALDDDQASSGVPADQRGLVVVGTGPGAPVATREVRARLGDRLWGLVPDQRAELAAAAEEGLVLIDHADLPAVQAMLNLADRIIPFTRAVPEEAG